MASAEQDLGVVIEGRNQVEPAISVRVDQCQVPRAALEQQGRRGGIVSAKVGDPEARDTRGNQIIRAIAIHVGHQEGAGALTSIQGLHASRVFGKVRK